MPKVPRCRDKAEAENRGDNGQEILQPAAELKTDLDPPEYSVHPPISPTRMIGIYILYT